jgi:ribosomal protein S18 acetylase RimI-like enzyme
MAVQRGQRERRVKRSGSMRTAGIRFARMSRAEFVAFEVRSIRAYAAFQVAGRLWTRRGAAARAAKAIRELLPHGLETPGHHCWTIRDRATEAPVGWLWCAESDASGQRELYIFDVEIVAEFRGRGYGRATLRALETWARRRRIAFIRLRVHAHNTVARALYEKAGYTISDLILALPIRRTARRRGD